MSKAAYSQHEMLHPQAPVRTGLGRWNEGQRSLAGGLEERPSRAAPTLWVWNLSRGGTAPGTLESCTGWPEPPSQGLGSRTLWALATTPLWMICSFHSVYEIALSSCPFTSIFPHSAVSGWADSQQIIIEPSKVEQLMDQAFWKLVCPWKWEICIHLKRLLWNILLETLRFSQGR